MKNILMPLWLSAAVLVSVPADAATESLEKLLGGIKADIAAKRLSSPSGNNALEKIDAFREEAPFDFRVVPLTYEWGEAYVALAESAIASKDYAKAQGYLDKVWLVASLTPGLEDAQATLDKVYKGAPAVAAKAEDKGPSKEELARQKKLAEAAAKEKARVEAERKRKAEEEKRLAAEAKKQAEADRKRKAEEERLRRAEAEKAEKAAAAKRVADAEKARTQQAKPAAAPAPVVVQKPKPEAPKVIAVASRQQRSEVSGLWKDAKEESAPLASYPVSAEMLSERDRDIVDSLEPVCKAILDNDASVVVHTSDKADYRWLTVRLTLCMRRLDKTFRLRHSYESVADAEPFVSLHPSREVSLVRQSTD
ncbi:hypothetical protein [Thalassolituus marinus]|uniref:TolA protein n=1 Tax=Thalassolituus marinus TaxID=671053 RepID=A0ABS7ZJX1_9GAMM|nr:hypothetical protein [Thalassolituus marinus]MCA6062001.1 hypothetical protein [Thalassolituus marinus]